MNYQRPNQFTWILNFAKEYRTQLFWYFILELLVIASSLLFVVWSKFAIDYAIAGNEGFFKRALLIAVASILIGFAIRIYGTWLNERTRIAMLVKIQNMLIKLQMNSTWKFVKTWHTGDLQVRINSDCQDVVQMIGGSFIGAVLMAIRLIASFTLLWVMDPMLAILILSISPLLIFSKLYFKKLRTLNQQLKKSESTFGRIVQENLLLRLSIRALGLQAQRWSRLKQSQGEVYRLKGELLNFSTFSQSVVNLFVNVGFLIAFVWGVYRLYTHEITFGTMSAFLQLVGRVQTPLLSMMGFVPAFIRFTTSLNRIYEIKEAEQEKIAEPVYVKDFRSIEIVGLNFQYEAAPIITEFDALMKKGEAVAILGSSGRGKTTLIRLILALIKPVEGNIWINGQDSRTVLSSEHRVNIAYVPQGDKLFSGTIRDNLMTGDRLIDSKKLDEVLYTSCAEFVHDLPEGLDTEVGESGYGLSEGQAQRIALARALLRDCPIWLFDEVTSALDNDTAQEVLKRLLKAGRNKLLVFVTHDLHLAGQCSKTIYMN